MDVKDGNFKLIDRTEKENIHEKRIYNVWGLKMFEKAVQSVQKGGQDVGKTYKS